MKITGLSDRAMREQIGAVCIQWSLLELMVERVIANLQGDRNVVAFNGSVTDRIKFLEKLARKRLPKSAEKIAAIASTIENLSAERHRVVHGLWAIDEDNAIVWSIVLGAKSPQPRAKQMETKAIRDLKLRIWQTYQQLEQFADQGKVVIAARLTVRSRRRMPASEGPC
jgi:ribosome biogenesis SPOUT family RNA methylase Rps3